MALKNELLSKNQNINIRSKYVLREPLYHQLLPYRAPPTFPKAKKPNDNRTTDTYTSIYKNWPQRSPAPSTSRIDDEIDGFYLPGHRTRDEEDSDDFIIIRRSKLPLLRQLNASQQQHHRPASSVGSRERSHSSDCSTIEEQHLEFIENRVKKFVHEAEKQTSDLLALTRANTNHTLDEKDDKSKRIRQRLFLKKNSPFSATQSVVATRLEEKLYATSPIDLLIQKNRTRCQYSQLPEIRRLNQLRISAEQNQQVGDILEKKRKDSVPRMGDVVLSKDMQRAIRGKSANAIGAALYAESLKKIESSRNVHGANQECLAKYGKINGSEEYDEHTMSMHQSRASSECRVIRTSHIEMMEDRALEHLNQNVTNSLEACRYQLKNFSHTSDDMYAASSKQTAIEIEQLNARLVEAETRLKTEVLRIKKKLQMTITELEMSLDVANKTNIDLQKTIKKQSLQLTEIQAHYDDIQRQLQQTLDQYTVAQRRIASLTGEIEEVRANYENALRGKRAAEITCEEANTKITELHNFNVSLNSMKAKLEQELSTIANDYEEVTRELRISDERYQKVQVELKSTIEILHEEQERIVKIETIKKSLEVEVKNLSIRLEEVEANAIVGSKRIISKLEARIRDLELELEEEKRRHAETIKILRKKERTVKEIMIQCEEDQKNVLLLTESLDKANQKISIYKRQLNEQEGMSAQTVTRVRRFQRELEAAEDRADCAESNLNMIRAKHRSFVTTSTVPGGAVYVVESTRTITE